MPQQERHRLLAALALLALLAGWHLFSGKGALRLHRLRTELAAVRAANTALAAEIRALATEIGRLEHDDQYLETFAREQYGLVRKNERIFRFKEKKKKKGRTSP